MFTKKHIIFLLVFLPLLTFFVGAGCNKTEKQVVAPVEEEKPVNKQPKEPDPYAIAIEACEEAGYGISLVYNEKTKATDAFCVFENSTACEVTAFKANTCSKNNGALPFNPVAVTEEGDKIFRYCDTTSAAVCGKNGATYANTCIAEVQNITILHEGPCLSNESGATVIPEERLAYEAKMAKKQASASKRTSPTASKKYTIPTDTERDWFSVLLDIAENEQEIYPKTFVEECKIGGLFYYYKTTGDTQPFSVLYDNEGKVVCFPNNDINEFCPKGFTITNRVGCTKVWP
ncbi:MAG: Kazal-type serine protease inhibitor [Candidatus Magasanikbacteria bacterium]